MLVVTSVPQAFVRLFLAAGTLLIHYECFLDFLFVVQRCSLDVSDATRGFHVGVLACGFYAEVQAERARARRPPPRPGQGKKKRVALKERDPW